MAIRYSQARSRRPALERSPGPPRAQERLLHQVLGLVERAEHPVAVHPQLAPVALDELLELGARHSSVTMATPPLRGRASEREALDRLIAGAREGRSGVLVIRGAAGVGKTALLRYAADQADRLPGRQIAGVESERELPFAGLQQFCPPLLTALDALPQPQRYASTSRSGSLPAPRRIASWWASALTSLAAYAEEQPVLWLVDDLQWLDEASAQVLGFVARRLRAEPVAIVFACAARASSRWPVCRSCTSKASNREDAARCSRPSSPAGSTSASAIG